MDKFDVEYKYFVIMKEFNPWIIISFKNTFRNPILSMVINSVEIIPLNSIEFVIFLVE